MYQGNTVKKRVPDFKPQDSMYEESLKDESKQLKNVYYDFSEFNPLNFKGAYMRSKIEGSSENQNQENSINLTNGTTVNFGEYSGRDVTLCIGESSVSMSWGSSPIGSAYIKKINDTIKGMLNGERDENGIPDLSKLTREQVAIIFNMEKVHTKNVMKLGGVKQYETICKMGESFDALIRVANGQMPKAAISPDMHENIKAGLEKVGIDTTKPFTVNGQKFYFSEGGVLKFFE